MASYGASSAPPLHQLAESLHLIALVRPQVGE